MAGGRKPTRLHPVGGAFESTSSSHSVPPLERVPSLRNRLRPPMSRRSFALSGVVQAL